MNQQLTYEQVINILAHSENDAFIQQVTILLTVVHDTIKEKALKKSDFIFTQYEEGHILVTDVKNLT